MTWRWIASTGVFLSRVPQLGLTLIAMMAFASTAMARPESTVTVGVISGTHVVEQGPDFITVEFSTPTQEHLTIGTLPGALVHVQNNQSGEEFEFYVSSTGAAESLADESEARPEVSRDEVRFFSIKLYQVVADSEGTFLKKIGGIERIRAGEEYLEPETGFVFSPSLGGEWKNRQSISMEGQRLILNCLDCGFYTICSSGRISTCNNTISR